MLITWHLLIPAGSGTTDLVSNTLRVPFSVSFKDAPAVDSITPNGYQSDTKSWQMQIRARSVDQTANTIIDDVAVTLDSTPSIDGSGNALLTVTIPQKSRSRGGHTIKVCRWMQNTYGPGQTASCSTVSNFNVTQIYETIRTPGAAGIALGRAGLAQPADVKNMQVARERPQKLPETLWLTWETRQRHR